MLQSKEDPNQPSTSAGNTVDNNLTRHIDDLIENIIGLTANEYEYDEILEQAFNTAQKSAESSEVLVDQELTVEVLENSPAIPIVVPAAIAVEQKDPKAYTLRDRKTTINYNEKKKKKIKILSNEPYEGELPSCAKKFSKKKDVKSSPDLRGSISNVAHEVIEIVDNEPEVQMEVQQPQQLLTMMAPMVIVGDQMFNFPIQNYFQNNMESVSLLHYTSNMDPNLSNMPILPQLSNPHNLVAVEMPTLIPLCSSAEKLARNNPEMLATSSDVASTVQVVPQQPESSNQINQPKTPKLPRNLNYLNSKSKSTPRRKGSHIRILDFNTPSKFHSKLHNHGKLSTIKEFSTPQGFIMGTAKTPSSAPPSMKSGGIILKKIERKKKEKK